MAFSIDSKHSNLVSITMDEKVYNISKMCPKNLVHFSRIEFLLIELRHNKIPDFQIWNQFQIWNSSKFGTQPHELDKCPIWAKVENSDFDLFHKQNVNVCKFFFSLE